MPATENKVVQRRSACRKSYPVKANEVLYEGTLVFINSSGYAVANTGSGANRFAGISLRLVDATGISDGDLNVEVETEGIFLLPTSGNDMAQSDIGKAIYADENYNVTKTAGANTVYIGRCIEVPYNYLFYVEISDLPILTITPASLVDSTGGTANGTLSSAGSSSGGAGSLSSVATVASVDTALGIVDDNFKEIRTILVNHGLVR